MVLKFLAIIKYNFLNEEIGLKKTFHDSMTHISLNPDGNKN